MDDSRPSYETDRGDTRRLILIIDDEPTVRAVVMLSAMSLGSDRARAVRSGADGYIVKPFSPRALLAELDRRLG